MTKNKPMKQRIYDKNPPNIDEVGTVRKEKRICYYCNELIPKGQVNLFSHNKKHKFACDKCHEEYHP